MKAKLDLRLLAVTNSVLLGWNVAVIVAFIAAIAVAASADGLNVNLNDTWKVVIFACVAIGSGAVVGVIAGRSIFKWFSARKPIVSGAWIVGLVALSWLSFPRPFTYVLWQ